MDWKSQLTKTPYLILFIVLITIGVGTASALAVYTFTGNVIVTGDIDVGGTITGVETLEGLNCTIDQIAKFNGSNWVCGKQTTKSNPITTVDSTDDVGWFSSIAIGTDDNPVISYWDVTNSDLKVVHCTNTSCSTQDIPLILDSTDDVGEYSSIAIGTDGNPVISYYASTGSDLKVVHCTNTSCSTADTPVILDSTDVVGLFSSIAIGADSNPVISYYDHTNGNLEVVHCTNASCSTADTPVTLDSTDVVGWYSSIAIGTDSYPVISYYDVTNDDLKVVHCTNASCSTADTPVTLDSTDDVGQFSSIAIGADGNPVISYYDFTNGNLKVARCGNISCSSGNVISIVDVGQYTSIAIGTDGNPVISYKQGLDLKVARCGNISCSAGNFITTIDSASRVTEYTSIAIGTDGNPVISYYDETNGDLKVVVDGTVLIFE